MRSTKKKKKKKMRSVPTTARGLGKQAGRQRCYLLLSSVACFSRTTSVSTHSPSSPSSREEVSRAWGTGLEAAADGGVVLGFKLCLLNYVQI
jgi:hypothetical protein